MTEPLGLTPDDASMCKHIAAVLYGVGARFDDEPELFFTLRQVDSKDLIAAAAGAEGLTGAAPRRAGNALFGPDLESGQHCWSTLACRARHSPTGSRPVF